jgi:hypothetical protein
VVIRVVFGVGDPDPREEYTQVMTKLMRANTATLMLVTRAVRSIGDRGPWARLLRLRGHLDRPLSAGMKQLQPSVLIRRREHV